jgi:hypothetical protein
MPGESLICNLGDQIGKLPPAEQDLKAILRSNNPHPRMSLGGQETSQARLRAANSNTEQMGRIVLTQKNGLGS